MALIRISDDNDVKIQSLENRITSLEQRVIFMIEQSKHNKKFIDNVLLALGTVVVSYVIGVVVRNYF